ncbi:MAG TPA: tetratricopeptide repeat protein, partial [Vicinamibacteria bacterium]|nr:tetratricopeptide repeat protein [Vicinamibacteria bacterium]
MRVLETVLGLCLVGNAIVAFPQDTFYDETPQHKALHHYHTGQDLMRQERFEEAIQEFKTATKLEPLMIFAYFATGRAQMALKQYGEAVQSFKGCDQAFRRLASLTISGTADPDHSLQEQVFELEASQFRAEVTSGRGRPTQEARTEMARMQNTIDDLKRLKEGLSSGPLPPPAECMLSLGSSLVHMGRLKDGEDAFKAAIQGRPKFGEAHNNLAV